MLKLKKDDPTFKTLNELAKKKNQSLRVFLLDEKNEPEICDVFSSNAQVGQNGYE